MNKTVRNLLLGAAGLAAGVGAVLFVKNRGKNAEEVEVETDATENEEENNDEE